MLLSDVKPDSMLSTLMKKIRERDEEIKKQANQLKAIAKMSIPQIQERLSKIADGTAVYEFNRELPSVDHTP